jgi:signal transduction histidine kinase
MIVDLHELLASLEAPIRGIVGVNVRVKMSLGATRPSVICDRGELERVLTNLATNARDAMPSGGALEIATMDVNGADGSRHSHVEVLVRDTGAGMDEATRRRVFEPSFTTKNPGTGQRLSLVAAAVEAMGGSIAVESAAGQGATFRILLTVAD